MLLMTAIPFLLVFYLINHQFSVYSEKATMSKVDQKHDQMLLTMTRELRYASETTHRSAVDYGIIHYAKLTDSAVNSKEIKELNSYTNSLLSNQMQQNPYVEQVCLTLNATNRTLCAQSSEGAEGLVVHVKGPYKSFEPLDAKNGKFNGYMLSYTEPVMDKPSLQELGRVTIWFNMSKLWNEMLVKNLNQAYALIDQQQRVVYRNGIYRGEEFQGNKLDADILQADDPSIYSMKHVVLSEGILWKSYYEAPQSTESLPYYHIWLLVIITLFVILSTSSTLLFGTYVTKPLNVLKMLMNRAERGDLRAYWTVKSSDEWMQLGDSYNQMLNRLEDLIKQVKKEESLKIEAEMEALHYQLNPHFLYNTLNTIKWVAKIHKTPQISEVVSALVRLLQASLGKKGEFIPLREEISLIHDYMEIQKFRYGDRIQVIIEVDKMTLGCLVPRMLLQPLIENAIIHGIEPSKREGVITIRTWLDRDLLFCQVEDNGIGMKVDEGSSGWNEIHALRETQSGKLLRERMSGIGLSHIREKIKLYYGPQFKMHIGSKPGVGTTIRMSLPIHQDEE
ncbi:putative sensor-like histidine kinase [compost metagenome]